MDSDKLKKLITGFHVLRVGIAITFLWIGVLIFREPEIWGLYIQPWAADLLPVSLKEVMIGTAILDVVIGLFLLVDVLVWLAALLGVSHLSIVLITSGINAITVRDLGLLAATLALVAQAWPDSLNFQKKK